METGETMSRGDPTDCRHKHDAMRSAGFRDCWWCGEILNPVGVKTTHAPGLPDAPGHVCDAARERDTAMSRTTGGGMDYGRVEE